MGKAGKLFISKSFYPPKWGDRWPILLTNLAPCVWKAVIRDTYKDIDFNLQGSLPAERIVIAFFSDQNSKK